MKLSRLECERIAAHNPIPLVRETKPELQPGQHIIVRWSRERKFADEEEKTAFTIPPKPVLWITVTKVTRRNKGGFSVRYDITDERDQALMPARGHGYTTDPKQAVDKNESPLSDKDRLRLATESRATHAERQERSKELRKRQERAVRAQLRDALDSLDPIIQQELLADVQRAIECRTRREAA